jgi:hypothetical protein
MLTKEQQVLQCEADDLGREIIHAMRVGPTTRAAETCPPTLPYSPSAKRSSAYLRWRRQKTSALRRRFHPVA